MKKQTMGGIAPVTLITTLLEPFLCAANSFSVFIFFSKRPLLRQWSSIKLAEVPKEMPVISH